MRQLGSGEVVLDRANLEQALRNLADELVAIRWLGEPVDDAHAPPWLVARDRGGLAVAQELSDIIALSEGVRWPVGAIDARTFALADEVLDAEQGVDDALLPGPPDGQRIVLIADVLDTGFRTRAALDALVHLGRPRQVVLAVLINRGNCALPLRIEAMGAVFRGPQRLQIQLNERGRIAAVTLV